jgi:N-methylhydantoinase A
MRGLRPRSGASRIGSVHPRDIGLVIHGTTLATNAIIERKGARAALITTEGFRDSVEMAQENRFDQYDVFMERPEPLVPRCLRFGVPERMDARGQVRVALNTARIEAPGETLRRERIESVAIGFLHSYANPAHEHRAREVLASELPGIAITLSSEVCPEVREYECFSTACANAYVQPRMAGYLAALRRSLDEFGLECPLLLMTSGGGLTTLETAIRFPIRLVESGPAGGAILVASVARRKAIDAVLSFDMGGTTAKICLIDGGEPQAAREFEVDRRKRFLKGSGLPVRVPVVEMVEIGAGGGSIAMLDPLRRIAVGPESAGAEPGPACYGRGGTAPTVTDADLALGRIDPVGFAGGRIRLFPERAQVALERDIGTPLGLDAITAAFGVSEMVEEAMANAARVHTVERGEMRYAGQRHDIVVPLPVRRFGPGDATLLRAGFEASYEALCAALTPCIHRSGTAQSTGRTRSRAASEPRPKNPARAATNRRSNSGTNSEVRAPDAVFSGSRRR